MFSPRHNEDNFFTKFFENKNEPTSVSNRDINIRLGFMKKVYGMLSIQLLTTILIGSLFMFVPIVKGVVASNPWILIGCALGGLGCLFGLQAKKTDYPTNIYLLAAFTLLESVTLGMTVTLYDAHIVLQALVLTLSILVGLTVYTFTSKKDFSWLQQSIGSGLWLLIIGGLLQLFFRSSLLYISLTFGGALLFSLFIIYDTHLIMKRLSPEEYILAVVTLYLDVINLFLKLLKILRYLQEENAENNRNKRNKRN